MDKIKPYAMKYERSQPVEGFVQPLGHSANTLVAGMHVARARHAYNIV